MSVGEMSAGASVVVPFDPHDETHVHTWELRAVEYDAWGQVSYYECLGCPGVRYV